ncbi:Uncharacterised protein [Chlamydia trachomatis]|nr:Uncharacterised protein [Chlamydia trachomatis]
MRVRSETNFCFCARVSSAEVCTADAPHLGSRINACNFSTADCTPRKDCLGCKDIARLSSLRKAFPSLIALCTPSTNGVTPPAALPICKIVAIKSR